MGPHAHSSFGLRCRAPCLIHTVRLHRWGYMCAAWTTTFLPIAMHFNFVVHDSADVRTATDSVPFPSPATAVGLLRTQLRVASVDAVSDANQTFNLTGASGCSQTVYADPVFSGECCALCGSPHPACPVKAFVCRMRKSCRSERVLNGSEYSVRPQRVGQDCVSCTHVILMYTLARLTWPTHGSPLL